MTTHELVEMYLPQFFASQDMNLIGCLHDPAVLLPGKEPTKAGGRFGK
jgi:hypothetical protein